MKMMRYGLFVVACLAAAASANAERYGMAGCGLGSMIMPTKGKFNQIIAVTLNATGVQTSGISSGTSNCVATNDMAVLKAQENFVASNLSSLSKEMAQGNGSTLTAFTETLGCSSDAQNDINAVLKSSYSSVFAEPGVVAVLDAAKATIKDNATVAAQCRYLNI